MQESENLQMIVRIFEYYLFNNFFNKWKVCNFIMHLVSSESESEYSNTSI